MSEEPFIPKFKSPEDVLKAVRDQKVSFINLWFTDITGVVKSITIPVSELTLCLDHGVWFDGSSIEGFARIAESDMYLRPDISTFAVIPWEPEEPKTARMICDVYTPQDEPFIGDPRQVLRQALEEARAMGFEYFTGPELEFFLFKPNPDGAFLPLIPHDYAGYFDVSTDLALNVRRRMVNALGAMGIQVEALHHEVATGQHEIDFRYADAIRSADHAVTYRVVLKAVAQRVGLHCTFMPKPAPYINGSGMHVHQSLTYIETGKNAFLDMDDEYGLSEVAKYFIAGQLKHARGLAAVVAPLVNSYKRLVPGYEAPVYISWARINRSALIRVPRTSKGREESTRLELRCPDPSCNPYLAFAAMLKAGLDGIKNKLECPDPREENLYHLANGSERLETLPGSLSEALDELERDEVIQQALGPHIFERYVEAKRQEYDEYRLQVTPWELDRYLMVY
ncbi:MAG: type I glutamate--ammonia ligase [Anaerolineae bacterium]|nr:type I glutamate--ammonia ligase [Anaerolineae bacterium]